MEFSEEKREHGCQVHHTYNYTYQGTVNNKQNTKAQKVKPLRMHLWMQQMGQHFTDLQVDKEKQFI